ncbi:MAG: NAD(P)-dependent oxidoreductase, partial [Planctomycetaceae bacterium]
MPDVLITPEKLMNQPSAPYVRLLQEAGFRIRYPDDPQFTRGQGTEDETIRQLEGVDALIAGGEHITPRVLDNVSGLRVIARSGVGFDRVDIPAATQHGIPVAITPPSNHEAVAEQTLALIFGVAKSVVNNDRRVRDGNWNQILTQPVRGQTLGLLGLGRIGRSTAIRGLSLGMHVIATEQFPDTAFVAEHGITLVDF